MSDDDLVKHMTGLIAAGLDCIEQLTAERDRFSSTVDTLERLRPHWAQGYSSDSMAAQASTAALAGIWEILGVSDQTSAVAALKELTAERDRLREDLEELDFLRHEGGPDSVAAIEAERDRLREVLTALHKQALMLRGEQSYREFARAVEKQARAALKRESHE